MSQHDFDIANQGFAGFRTDLNNALQALASLSSGTAAPATTYANQLWYETDTDTLWLRNEANSAWLSVMVIDQSTGALTLAFADGTAALPSIANTGDLNTGLYFPAADTVAVATAGTERMRIDSSGNVGIGTTSPIAQVGIQPALSAGAIIDALHIGQLSGTNPTVGQGVRITLAANSTLTRAATITAAHESGTNAHYMAFGTSANGAAPAERVRIDSSGNVGIGTSGPQTKLDVRNGDITLSRTAAATAGDAAINFGNGTSCQIFGGNTTNIMAFSVNASERMRIDSSGNVGIGASSPTTPLSVSGDTSLGGVVYRAQPAQTSKAAAATLTIAELLTGIIQYTGAAATLTLPTGTSIEGGLPATFPTNMSFDVSFINTGAALLTIGANGNTTVGTMTVATGTSGRLRFRKTAANTYTVYRIS